jgi:hypothetical protein
MNATRDVDILRGDVQMLDRPRSDGGNLPAVPLRVLMTEDNPRDAKLVARLLEDGGARSNMR